MKLKAVILLCVCSLLSMTGCSGKEEQPEVVVDNFEELVQNGEENPTQEPKTEMQEETTSKETDMKNPTQEEAIPKETNMEILEGNIKSIGNESVVVCKSYTMEAEDGLVMVSSADESGNETLVTVNFTEDMKWELHTVKNGGINGDADVTISEASFSDLKEGVSVKMTGYYVTEEKEFTADSVVIYCFV
ncbi:hypothetical protein D3Z60_18530 [Lachnospiraceae bacterium]|jgi:hypothetical protein|nr:hypothetical protein [Lachnospiraceae bacterium]